MNPLHKAEAPQPLTGQQRGGIEPSLGNQLGNSNGNLGRLNITWYLSRSNVSNYTILIINIQYVPQHPFFNLLLDKLVSYLNDLKENEILSTVKVRKEILGTKTPHKVL